ncbi:MAG: GGDEF domain-containing protein [Candidatus Dormibacteraeota bacterium]|nr:GGDEF domain-containing protein [Candidatus Dormibacteraeota bacterium]
MQGLPNDSDLVRAIGETQLRGEERRDHTARSVRDALAARLGIDPRLLGSLDADTATRALANLNLTIDRLRQLEEEAAVDELTGVYRRGHGMMILTRELRRAFRSPDERLVVAFIDVNGLKRFNDTMGHAEGDRLLTDLTAAMTKRLRAHDIVFRYGGDEFVCILPGANLEGAAPIFAAVAEAFAEGGRERSFSVGLAELREGDSPETLVARADTALYEARAAAIRPGGG